MTKHIIMCEYTLDFKCVWTHVCKDLNIIMNETVDRLTMKTYFSTFKYVCIDMTVND